MTLEERFQTLSRHRQAHAERVAAVMRALAQQHHLDEELAWFGGWAHDLAREMSRPALLAEAETLGIVIGPEEQAEPLLLHGPIAAKWVERAGRGTPQVLEAIRYHTTGAANLGPLAQALFIADGVEPGRRYALREALYLQALEDLNGGYCAVLKNTQAYLLSRGLAPHPDMVRALDQCTAGTVQDTH
ncbi:bis(5'-nucleosyl)-tetraphosphatase (symmetrical) YqeK [Sulfobacillus harzensis]|uniref:bis(5'-nucleosyl)-tetraphosphatase (symmetrical) n=1 Tax=Sulfobacillus harzensis TaxID=2729629 RepID=A0A7Y0L1A5_9FIRM|nr:HD domain-containing protein [Sulfobacillus harzensis]